VEPVTIIETPPMVAVGIVGYSETPKGLKAITAIWADHISQGAKRRFYKNWKESKKKAFTKKSKAKDADQVRKDSLDRLRKEATVIRVLAHSQFDKLKNLPQKKDYIMEIQVNGGSSVSAKVDFAKTLLEKEINVNSVFRANEQIDTIGISRGRGWEGVTTRWGTRRLPRKTRKGLRKVACVGPWHPSRIFFSVARSGQMGFNHRTEVNKKIFKIGKSRKTEEGKYNAQTKSDLTKKDINPMGGFPHYGMVNNDYLMIKGGVVGPVRRVVTMRKVTGRFPSSDAKERVDLKWIDTSSKIGPGRFQTAEEKEKYFPVAKTTPVAAAAPAKAEAKAPAKTEEKK